MNRARGVIFTLRKHKKKAIFASGVLCYGFHYVSKKFREHIIRKEYFNEAKEYGVKFISPLDKPRRLYVILNPTASNGNCKALFTKNAAPILNLAGIDVTYIQTDYEGHAKTTVNYFDPTIDGVVVAGGNGVLQEVVTGMFRQSAHEENIAALPVGFIPLGANSNFMYNKLFSSDAYQVRSICKATMAIVRGNFEEASVMEIESSEKPVYALSNIHYGVHQQVKEKIDAGKYWLLGPWKKYFAFVWRTCRDWPPSFNINVNCSGNSSKDLVDPNVDGEGENCEQVANFSIFLQEKEDGNNEDPTLLVQQFDNDQPRTEFIKFGWSWMENKFNYISNNLSETKTCKEILLKPSRTDESYDIDGEIFDARPVTIRIDSRKLRLFSDPTS